MKLFISISLSVSMLFSFYSHVFGNEQYETLHTLMSIAKENKVDVSHWTIYSRGHVDYVKGQVEMDEHFQQIMNEYPEFKWHQEVEKVDHHFVMTGIKENEREAIKEKMIITAYPYNGQYEINRSYELSGAKWTEAQQRYLSDVYSDLFSGSEMFYTIRGQAVKKQGDLEVKALDLVESYDGEVIEGIYENDFIAISAYSNKIETQIMTKGGEEMNLQMGMRTSEASSTVDVTIGTPIITTEY
jgi:hypothetical protein